MEVVPKLDSGFKFGQAMSLIQQFTKQLLKQTKSVWALFISVQVFIMPYFMDLLLRVKPINP